MWLFLSLSRKQMIKLLILFVFATAAFAQYSSSSDFQIHWWDTVRKKNRIYEFKKNKQTKKLLF